MDPRLYHYQYRRPRLNNPTYTSNNVNSSLTYFVGGSISRYGQMSPSNLNQQQIIAQRPRASSQLSNYGTKLLAFNQKDIYDKQNNKFDIISLKPKQYQQSLKQYPKLTLQNQDTYYYQKLKAINNSQHNRNHQQNNQIKSQQLAGKQTFIPAPNKISLQDNYHPQAKRYFTPKMLNHVDEISNIL